jgi:5,10-methylenetetrahydrofolate reductase
LSVSIELDPEATSQAKERVSGLMEKLKKKGQGEKGIIRDQEG